MTVIAYRRGIMAADTMATMESNRGRQEVKFLCERKIMQHKGYLLAMAGEACPNNAAFLEWFFDDIGELRRPRFRGMSFDAMVVTPTGKVQIWDHKGNFEPVSGPFFSIGSGQEFALGAMEAGATAPRAVAIAIKRSPSCSGQVITRRARIVRLA